MENSTETMWVRKILQRNAFGRTNLRLWELYGIAADRMFSSACRAHSTPVSTFRHNRAQGNRNELAMSCSLVGRGRRVRRWWIRKHPLQVTRSICRSLRPIGWDRCSLCPWSQGALSLLNPIFPKCLDNARSSSHPIPASPHYLHFLIPTFKNENATKTAFFLFSFSDFTLSFLGLWSAKSLYTSNTPWFADWQAKKNQ